jgi:hypothetical protein
MAAPTLIGLKVSSIETMAILARFRIEVTTDK